VISGETIGKHIDGIDGEIVDVIPLGINWGFYMVLMVF
jgi:S-ribosylhomocysteine lyase LuxS involved in autoinducer biosynthesis